MLLTHLIPLLSYLSFCNSIQNINITIMVPGITAFNNLVKEVKSFPHLYFSGYKHLITNYSRNSNESDLNSTSFQFSAFVTDHEPYLNKNKEVNDFDSVLEVHHFTYSWSYFIVKPALDAALKKIENTPGFLDNYKINLCFYDSGNKIGKASDR